MSTGLQEGAGSRVVGRLALPLTALLIAATLWLGTSLPGRWSFVTSTLVVVESMLPLLVRFEARRPQARELALIAALAALAAASRVAFAFAPGVKPIVAVVMAAGIAYGGEVGFVVGALAALTSNFFFGQGPWTPWQMMSYGVGGLLAGAVFHGRPSWQRPIALAAFGGAAVLLVVGPLLDACTVFTTGSVVTPAFVAAVLAAGLPANATLGLSTAVVLGVAGRPLLRKLDRLSAKHGMLA